MAYNFDSGQFSKEATPKRLGNWEVPRWSPSKARPLEYRPSPTPICDINGHFLPGAPRGTSRCFGHYRGTWELPRKITRKVAEELQKEPPEGRFPDWLNLRVQRPEAAAAANVARMRQKGKGKKGEKDSQLSAGGGPAQAFIDSEQDQALNASERDSPTDHYDKDDPFGLRDNKPPVDDRGNGPYVPGSLTQPDQRHETYDKLVKNAVEEVHGPQEDKTDKFWRKVAENALKHEEETMKIKKNETKLPQVHVSKNFEFAKNMHVTNLEHQPLPDTLGYRNLTKIAEHRDSDIVVKPYAIGWKGYGASGPTCCTKLRVHRPKTCDLQKQDDKNDQKARPSTSAPDLGGQYGKPMSLMDLAICWDFKPRDPKSEPRPPKHIDGSNGSKAPAVFTMVHTPKEEIDGPIFGHSNPIFNDNRPQQDDGRHSVPYFEKDMSKDRRRDSCEVQYCPKHTSGVAKKVESVQSSRRNSAQTKPKCDGINGCGTPSETSRKSSQDNCRPEKLQPIKEAWNTQKANGNGYNVNYNFKNNRNSLESYEKTPLAQGKLNQSSPNESQRSRSSNKNSDTTNNNDNAKHKHCISCNGTKIPQEIKQRDDYKFAFKAGNPNSVQSVSSSNGSKSVKMPKMRHPYTKKSYSIPTLTPPFSIWRNANASGYPEHWRLASVYQHAYKPPEQRRKPLIDSVFQ